MADVTLESATRVEVRRRASYPSDDLGFLQRTHPLRAGAFGRLVYMADSVMQPPRQPGFGMHPHASVEVVSYAVDGTLTHRDTAGHIGTPPPGGFQVITGGTGIEHDESNRTDRPLRMFQIWFAPRARDVAPSYAVAETAGRLPEGRFPPVVGAGGLPINADASVALARLAPGGRTDASVGKGNAALLYVVEGAIRVGDVRLERQDRLRAAEAIDLEVVATSAADLMLIESAQ